MRCAPGRGWPTQKIDKVQWLHSLRTRSWMAYSKDRQSTVAPSVVHQVVDGLLKRWTQYSWLHALRTRSWMALICMSMTSFMDQSGLMLAMVSKKCFTISMPPSASKQE